MVYWGWASIFVLVTTNRHGYGVSPCAIKMTQIDILAADGKMVTFLAPNDTTPEVLHVDSTFHEMIIGR